MTLHSARAADDPGDGDAAWTGGLLHDWTDGHNAVIGFSVISLLLAMTPFLNLRTLRQ